MQRAQYFCPILPNLDFLNGRFVKIPNIKFYVYVFLRSRADTYGRKDEPKGTDGRADRQMEMKKVIGAYRDFVNAPEKAPPTRSDKHASKRRK